MAAAALAVAIVGAVTGMTSLIWNVMSWRREGWSLRISGVSPVGFTVTNVGRQACVMLEAGLYARARHGGIWLGQDWMRSRTIRDREKRWRYKWGHPAGHVTAWLGPGQSPTLDPSAEVELRADKNIEHQVRDWFHVNETAAVVRAELRGERPKGRLPKGDYREESDYSMVRTQLMAYVRTAGRIYYSQPTDHWVYIKDERDFDPLAD